MSKSCQKVVKSCQKSFQKVFKKLSKICQKVVKKFSKSCQKALVSLVKNQKKSESSGEWECVAPGKKRKNPRELKRVATNLEFVSDKLRCQKCRNYKAEYKSLQPFQQCEKCVVTISQTKMGACLQFLWNLDNLYCSIDLGPTFKINKITALNLAYIVNIAMLKERPDGWFRYLQKYATSDMIFLDLFEV
jgi:hypothetical protein